MQAGALYRVMREAERRRLIDNLAASLVEVSRPAVFERSVGHFRQADAEYGGRLAEAIAARRSAKPR